MADLTQADPAPWLRAAVAGMFNLVADVFAAAGAAAAVLVLAGSAWAERFPALPWAAVAASAWGAAAVLASVAVLVSAPRWPAWSDAAVAAGVGGALARVLGALSQAGVLGGVVVAVAGGRGVAAALMVASGVAAGAAVRPVRRAAVAVLQSGAGWASLPGALRVALGWHGAGVAVGEAALSGVAAATVAAGLLLVLAGAGGGVALALVGLWLSTRLRRRLARGLEARLLEACRATSCPPAGSGTGPGSS